MSKPIITTKTRNGLTVLAKTQQGMTTVKTFANLTQATKAAAEVGGHVTARWPFLVVVAA